MGKMSDVAADIAATDEMRSRLTPPMSRARRVSVINREITELLQVSNTLHHQMSAVPECLPLSGDAAYQLRQVRLTIDAILRADERSAERAA